jgi:hypothetical protein
VGHQPVEQKQTKRKAGKKQEMGWLSGPVFCTKIKKNKNGTWVALLFRAGIRINRVFPGFSPLLKGG